MQAAGHSSPTLAVVVTALVVAACGESAPPHEARELGGEALGTTFSVQLVDAPAQLSEAALSAEIRAALERVDASMSTWRADSELSRFNAHRSADWFPVSHELCTLVAEALAHAAATDGAFDVTVGPLVSLWGFGPDPAITEPPEDAEIELIREATGFSALHADCAENALRKDVPGLYIDLSAIAKGYAVDVLADLLNARNATNYLVEVGGEMRLRGYNPDGKPWSIAIESPQPGGRSVYAIMSISDVAVATSGDYRNYFEYEGQLYSHTIDPRTGYPVAHDVAAVTVLAESAADADALATALMVLGPEAGYELAEREAIPAFFLSRGESGIDERATSTFPEALRRP